MSAPRPVDGASTSIVLIVAIIAIAAFAADAALRGGGPTWWRGPGVQAGVGVAAALVGAGASTLLRWLLGRAPEDGEG